MKKQKKILWKKGIHVAFSEKWNAGFGSFKKFYFPQTLGFLKAKLGRPLVWHRQLKRFQCDRKGLHSQKTWIRDIPLCSKTKSAVATQNVSTLYAKGKRKTKHFTSSSQSILKLQADKSLSSAKNLDHEYCKEKSLLKAVTGLSANTVLDQANGHRPSTDPRASDFPMKFNGESQSPGDSGKTVVLNKHRKRVCYGCCQGLEHHRNRRPLIPKKFQLNQHQRVKVSLMMYEKLSMIRFRNRIFRSQHFRTKGRVCKLRKAQRSWVQKVTGDHQENLRDNNTEGGNCSPVPSLEPKDPCRCQPYFPDMDSSAVVKGKICHVPDGHTKESPVLDKAHGFHEALPDQQNGNATYTWDQSSSSPTWACTEQTHEVPLMEHPSSDKLTLETERALMTLGQGKVLSVMTVKLSVSGADKSASSVDGPESEEPALNESFQMEEGGSLKQNILSSKCWTTLTIKVHWILP